MDVKLGKYRHFKGGLYEVVGFVRHSETVEEMVLYKALYDSKEFRKGQLWVRPKHMWNEEVEYNGQKVRRFTKIDDSNFKN